MAERKFSELDDYIAAWGLPTAHERLARRAQASMAEIRAFYDAIVPQLDDIIGFLNGFPVDDIPEQYRPLAWTALAACEIDDAVNIWHAPNLDFASDMRTWRVKESQYDYR